MKAVQYVRFGEPVEVREIEKPVPGPGEILLRITAAGVCHSDIAVQQMPKEIIDRSYNLPLTLGHEPVGVVAELGPGAGDEFAVGDAVVVYGPWGCGTCHACSGGAENYCTESARLGIRPPGLGTPGALAEYMIVDSARHLVPIGDLDPVQAAPLADAALTPYHAIKKAMHKLGAGSVAVVIGAGGLGHMAIRLLKLLTPATVVALDVDPVKLELAKRVGADHTFLSNDDAIEPIRALNGGKGADVVFDIVGVQPAVELGAKLLGMESVFRLIGVADGALPVGIFTVPFGAEVGTSYWGTRQELIEVIEMARRGLLPVETTTYSLDEGPEVYARFFRNEIVGRAVVVP